MPFLFRQSRAAAFVSAAICLLAASASVCSLSAAEADMPAVAILVSMNIKPYIEAVEGFKEKWPDLSSADAQVFALDQYEQKRRPLLGREIEGAAFGAVVAVGPEAMRFTRDEIPGFKGLKIYTMILNPENILGGEAGNCGIEIGIPTPVQIDYFRQAIPGLKRIGLLYNADQNGTFAENAKSACRALNIQLIPLEVRERKDIPDVIRNHWTRIDGLWMIPDHVVVSESIIRHIIKEAIFQNVLVFGFNRFFYDNGAALAFIMDYREIGGKTAALTFDRLNGRPCGDTAPVFRTWINGRVIKRAGFTIPEKLPMNIEAGP